MQQDRGKIMAEYARESREEWGRLNGYNRPVSWTVITKSLLMGFVDCLIAWQDRAAERHHLSGLDDRLLKDINLSRADVEQEISKPFWQR